VQRESTNKSEEKQSPVAESIWILNNTTEQNTHVDIKAGKESDFLIM